MLTWNEFVAARPDLAQAGRDLLYQFSVGLAFMATVKPDGGPRMHPMCPILTDTAMYAFITPSPKQSDLRHDGRYSLHSFPCPDNEDGFSVSGNARLVDDVQIRTALADQMIAEREMPIPRPTDVDLLFEFLIDRCLLTRTKGHGDPAPDHTIWIAGG
jgi:hypothetical protein